MLFTATFVVSWFVLTRALARLGARVAPVGRIVWPLIWILILAADIAFTHLWGPSFTALYHMSGWALFGSLALWATSLILLRAGLVGRGDS